MLGSQRHALLPDAMLGMSLEGMDILEGGHGSAKLIQPLHLIPGSESNFDFFPLIAMITSTTMFMLRERRPTKKDLLITDDLGPQESIAEYITGMMPGKLFLSIFLTPPIHSLLNLRAIWIRVLMMKAMDLEKSILIPIFAIQHAKHAMGLMPINVPLATQDSFIGKEIALPKIP